MREWMQEIDLVNYRHAGSIPGKSITQLPRDEAFRMAERLYRQSQCPAHRRFGPDFPGYYAYRMEIEAELYRQFCALGGAPQIAHPYYFALQHCENLYRNFDQGQPFRLKLRDVDPAHISFTYGDSMAQWGKPAMRPLFDMAAFTALLEAHHGDVEALLESIREPYICIEAQLWSDQYFSPAAK